MGKRKNIKKGTIQQNKVEKPIDLWTAMEQNGSSIKTAHQVFYKKSGEEIPQTKHYEKFKNKRKKLTDGREAVHADTHHHKNENVTKRRLREEEIAKKKMRSLMDYEYITKDMAEYFAKKNNKEYSEEDRRKINESHAQLLDIVDRCVNGVPRPVGRTSEDRMLEEENFEGLEDDDDDADSDLVMDPSCLPDYCFEEEPYGSPTSCSDGEIDDDEEEDEEDDHEDCSSCSEVSEQDAASDEEGNLGEDRTASVLKKKSKSMPMDFDKFPFSDDDSSVTATRALAWLISSCDVQTFFNDFYQQNCLVVQRNHPEYYGNLFSSQRLSELLEKNYVEYGVNINVAEYKNSVRITPNGKGRAFPRQIKAHLKQGRSVQLTSPQAFDDHIWYLCEVLQEVFGCFVGANTYLTPADSSGFAPHWDDIDAFLLQIEGRKYWKIYAPQGDEDELPRESSGNFTEADMKKRKPTFEGWIEAGDLLYIPRGFIHQARTDKKVHSLHVTVSTGRQWTFADLMDKLVPETVTALAQERMKMRKGLPIGLLDMNGVADYKYRMEEYFVEKFVAPLDRHMAMLRNKISDSCLESAVDIMAREFMKTALPPVITPAERKFHVLGQSGESLLVGSPLSFHPQIYVRLMRRHGQRLIFETEEQCFIAHRINNSRLYEGREEQTIDLDIKYVPAFTTLLDHCPEWTKVGELPELTDSERRSFCQLLYDSGILLAKNVPSKKEKAQSH